MGHIENNNQDLQRVIAYIQSADQRASIVLAFNSALGYTSSALLGFLKSARGRPIISWRLLVVGILFLFLASVGLSLFYTFKVIMPKIKDYPRHKMFFFSTITQYSKDDFIKRIGKVSDEEVLGALAEQIYVNAKVANYKFDYLGKSWNYLSWAVVFGIVFLIISGMV